MLTRESEWVWDSWYLTDGDDLHAFYLKAPKALGDPDRRHVNATVGHSVSTDGRAWTHLPDALGPSAGEDFDNQAIWTGSIVRGGDQWHLFYTGINTETRGSVQAIGHATSTDLVRWERASATPILTAAAPYAQQNTSSHGAEPFRDPWVFQRDGVWHMLVTAEDADGWGTIAHAVSTDLTEWRLEPPLVTDSRFRQLEVAQVLEVDGAWILLFCAAPRDVERPGITAAYGTYSAPADGPLGPFHLDRAEPCAVGVYAARAVRLNDQWVLLGFLDSGEPGGFTGAICDPIPVRLSSRGTLVPAP